MQSQTCIRRTLRTNSGVLFARAACARRSHDDKGADRRRWIAEVLATPHVRERLSAFAGVPPLPRSAIRPRRCAMMPTSDIARLRRLAGMHARLGIGQMRCRLMLPIRPADSFIQAVDSLVFATLHHPGTPRATLPQTSEMQTSKAVATF
jgi:hypothetical protein